MSITHEEARGLIQLKADNSLKEVEKRSLDAHLDFCLECQNYAAQIHELESSLQPLLQRKWNQAPPLPGKVRSGKYSKFTENFVFATRMAAMGIICIAFLFNIWQFTRSGVHGTIPPSAQVPLIPTPATDSTNTISMEQNCQSIPYKVRENDTLGSIANQFSVSPEKIIRANNLRTATLNTSMQLVISSCNPTPSRTSDPVTTTFTPLLDQTTLTPVNGPTQ